MEKTPAPTSEFKGQDLKKQLLDCLDREARQFSDVARNYFDKKQLSPEDKTGLLSAIVAMIDHIMDAGDWNSSLFLRNTLKPLVDIRTEAQAELNRYQEKSNNVAGGSADISEDEAEVYISLFQSDGYNIGKWAMQLRSLDRYIIGRPVYATEDDVQKRVRLRSFSGDNEAYVIVVVKKNDIQKTDALSQPMKDQFDSPLLSLKEVALKNGRIHAFVHQGKRYRFVDGQLIG